GRRLISPELPRKTKQLGMQRVRLCLLGRSRSRGSKTPIVQRYQRRGLRFPQPALENETQEVEQKLRRQESGNSGWIIDGCHFYQIHADHVSALCQPLKYLEDFIMKETAVAGRAGAWGDRGIEAVDV